MSDENPTPEHAAFNIGALMVSCIETLQAEMTSP
jgi:hypothetical protein